jgi:hypothetical protein
VFFRLACSLPGHTRPAGTANCRSPQNNYDLHHRIESRINWKDKSRHHHCVQSTMPSSRQMSPLIIIHHRNNIIISLVRSIRLLFCFGERDADTMTMMTRSLLMP